MTGVYKDSYGRTVTRSLTLFDERLYKEYLPGYLGAICTWDVLVNAQYVYSDGQRASRLWKVVETMPVP